MNEVLIIGELIKNVGDVIEQIGNILKKMEENLDEQAKFFEEFRERFPDADTVIVQPEDVDETDLFD